MRLPLGSALLLLLLVPHLPAKSKAVLPDLVVQARYVYVTSDYGSQFSANTFPDDRQAISDVREALNKWKKYIVVNRREQADLILLVRKGRLAAVRPRVVIGKRAPDEVGETQPGVGTQADFGSSEDLLSVYDARRGGIESALWRQYQAGGLDAPGVPLLARFRKDVEDAAKKKP
jgi:hypothetical protein